MREATVVEGRCIGLVQLEGLVQRLDREGRITRLETGQPQQLQRIEILRVERQNLPVRADRRAKLAALLQGQRLLQRLADVRGHRLLHEAPCVRETMRPEKEGLEEVFAEG